MGLVENVRNIYGRYPGKAVQALAVYNIHDLLQDLIKS